MLRRDWSILGIAAVVFATELVVWLARPAQLEELPPALPIPIVHDLGTPAPMPTILPPSDSSV